MLFSHTANRNETILLSLTALSALYSWWCKHSFQWNFCFRCCL